MILSEGVRKYLELAGDFGKAAPLEEFGLSRSAIESCFAAWDEDYQINRFMLLTLEPAQGSAPQPQHAIYRVNGFEYTHVTFQSQIEEML